MLVRPTGTKSWQFRYQFLGKEKTLSIGQYPFVSLADARKRRDEAKRLLADGSDPSVQKQLDQINAKVKARMTFREVADEYYETLVDRGLADATLRKKRWHIDDLAKPLHARPIDQINASELLHLLKPIERSEIRARGATDRGPEDTGLFAAYNSRFFSPCRLPSRYRRKGR